MGNAMRHFGHNRYWRIILVLLVISGTAVLLPEITGQGEEVSREKIENEINDAEEAEQRMLSGLHAGYAVLLDGDSGRMLSGKEADVPRPMASTTKIMTCILALEHSNDADEVVTASANAASQPKVRLNVREGEQFCLKDLLYSMMLESHNDSAVMIAEHIGGSVRGFASLMNKKAAEIGCENTYYITPNGLDASDEQGVHSTTARELALVMRYCMKESPKREEFLAITGTSDYQFQDATGERTFSCTNHNAFLTMMDGAISGKTGFTADAGYCYVGALKRDDRTFIVALLACGWPNHKTYKWQDTRAMMDYGLQYYEKKTYDGKVSLPMMEVDEGLPENGCLSGVSRTNLCIRKNEAYQVLLREDENPAYDIHITDRLAAPVKKGTMAGSLCLTLQDQVLMKWEIETADCIEKRDYIWCLIQLTQLFIHFNKFR